MNRNMEEKGIVASVARLGGFPPNCASFVYVRRGKNTLGGCIKFGLLLSTFGEFLFYITIASFNKVLFLPTTTSLVWSSREFEQW